jgi:hypothetical protein
MISESPFKWRQFEGQIILLCVSTLLPQLSESGRDDGRAKP